MRTEDIDDLNVMTFESFYTLLRSKGWTIDEASHEYVRRVLEVSTEYWSMVLDDEPSSFDMEQPGCQETA